MLVRSPFFGCALRRRPHRTSVVTLAFALLLGWGPSRSSAQPAPDAEATDPAGEGAADAQPAEPGEPGQEGQEGDALGSQDDAAIEEARARYAQGAEFYRRERYSAAIAEFTEAYRLWQNPVILFALGQAYEGDAQVQLAIETYERFLETAPETDGRRDEVQNRIRLLNRLLATVLIQSNVAADVYVDGAQAGRAPGEIRVATGRHDIELRAEGYRNASQVVSVAAGTRRELNFELREIEQRTEIIRVTEDREPVRFPRPVFYAAAGITGASAVSWVALAGAAKRRANRYNDMPNRTAAERDAARDAGTRADVMLGVTGGLAVTTLVIGLLTDWDDDDDDDDGGSDESEGPEDPAGATGPAPEANVIPQEGGAVLLLGWRR